MFVLLAPLFLVLYIFRVYIVLPLLYWKKWLSACLKQRLNGRVLYALVLMCAVSIRMDTGEGGQSGSRRAGGRWAGGRNAQK